MSTPAGIDSPGTYVVTVDREKTTVEADSFDYNGPDGSLQAWKDGKVIATFRWCNSIVRKAD